MIFRTDLALERREAIAEECPGTEAEERTAGKVRISHIRVINEEGERALGKPKGSYITLEVPPFSADAEMFDGRIDVMAKELAQLLPKKGTALVVGLGNHQITPDALGPRTMDTILATRHLSGELLESIGLPGLRPVCAAAPGVLGQTGIETSEIIEGLAARVKPAVVIVIDALASRSLSRLGCTVQISDTGIEPGAGVGNRRKEISSRTLGVPVIAIGVPTVVDATTLAADLLADEKLGESVKQQVEPRGMPMMVTPREIDLLIQRASRLLALVINSALQPDLSPEDILSLVS